MKLEDYYDGMWQQARPRLLANDLDLDPQLGTPTPVPRFGLTLRLRPDAAVQAAVQPLLAELRQLEPAQYFYPPSDQHVTVLTLISGTADFALEQIDAAAYAALLGQVLRPVPPFAVAFRGVTASAGAVLLQGFPLDDTLADLRGRLRAGLPPSGLRLTLDARYVIQTAHCTLLRFRAPLRRPAQLVRVLEQYRQQAFGTMWATELELVFNDWYHRAALVRPLASLRLC